MVMPLMRPSRAFAAVLSCLAAVGSAVAEAPVIHSGSEPAGGVRRVELVEQWRAGGDDDVLFGIITSVAADDAGRIYLADWQLCQLHVFDEEGRRIGTLSREGEGPGEIRQPSDVVILPDGRIGIKHRARGRITCVAPDGTPAEDVVLTGPQGESLSSLGLMRCDRRGATLAVQGFSIVFTDNSREETHFLRLHDLDGRQRYEAYARPQHAFDFERKTYTERLGYEPVWALGPDGSLFLVPERNLYRIEHRGPDGALLRIIERDHIAHVRTAREKEAAAGGASMTINGQRVPLECDIEDRAPCIAQIDVDDQGGLWVLHSESRPPDPSERVLRYDYFDPAGLFLERVEVASPADPDHDQLIMLDPRRFIVLRGISDAWQAYSGTPADEGAAGEAEPLEVVCYHATR